MRGVYPDAHMIDGTGDAPACGLWARHVRGLYLEGYEVRPAGNDPRPFLVSADAEFASPVPLALRPDSGIIILSEAVRSMDRDVTYA